MAKDLFKYNEDEILSDIINYIGDTYDQHYNTQKGVQGLDVWIALGNAETTARDTALKYLMRYGKKNGKNKMDLYKAIHYIVIMLHLLAQDEEAKDEAVGALKSKK